jgi:hypothetical protein
VNANSVLLFTTIPPSRANVDFLTPTTLSARLDRRKPMLCPITFDQIPLRNAMISNAGAAFRNIVMPSSTHSPQEQDPTENESNPLRRAGVFPNCGHVFELPPPHLNNRLTSCPKCRVVGRMVPLLLQTAPTLLPFESEYTHVLPCGHAVSLELGKRFAAVALPTNELLMGVTDAATWGVCLGGRKRRCWFCGAGFYATDLKKLYFEEDEY